MIHKNIAIRLFIFGILLCIQGVNLQGVINKTGCLENDFLVSLGYIEKQTETESEETPYLNSLIISERFRILDHAEKFWNEPPISVTSQACERSAGSINDFYSEGDYWWPDPNNPDGPYIRKDGLSNPDNFSGHRLSMIRMSKIVGTMASAYLLTGNEKYVTKAMEHLRAWFISEDTKMNPHLLYAQAVKGRYTGRGIGIIDAIHLIEPALAIRAMETSSSISQEELNEIKQWFGNLLKWISTHEYGKSEMVHPNNHGTCWALQAAAYALLTDDTRMLEFCVNRFKDHLLPSQMAEDGSFPLELNRTKPYGYSIFNLDAMSSLVQVLSNAGYDLFSFKTEDGRSLQLGMEFLFPYIKNKEQWSYGKDVLYFDEYPVRQAFMIFGGVSCQQPEYIDEWLNLDSDPDHGEVERNMIVKNPLLWFDLQPMVETTDR